MSQPLVTVICLCYNHERFVEEALQSVFNQTYPHIELLVVDDASIDESRNVIKRVLKDRPGVEFISLDQNVGNCRAFNMAWRKAKGDFVIDLAADDILLPNRIERGVAMFLQRDHQYGVQFSDAEMVNEDGVHLSFHADRFPSNSIPEGHLYQELIRRYFICSPTMMFRRQVVERLEGYDETLAYEDFDFWIRSSREFLYFYIPEVLVKRRIVRNSMSQQQFKRSSRQQLSTWRVCEKIHSLNRNDAERRALDHRLYYECRQCIKRMDFILLGRYLQLWLKNR